MSYLLGSPGVGNNAGPDQPHVGTVAVLAAFRMAGFGFVLVC